MIDEEIFLFVENILACMPNEFGEGKEF